MNPYSSSSEKPAEQIDRIAMLEKRIRRLSWASIALPLACFLSAHLILLTDRGAYILEAWLMLVLQIRAGLHS